MATPSAKKAYIAFPGADYTQRAAWKAAKTVLASRGWTVTQARGDDSTVPEGQDLYLTDYDLLPFEQLLPSATAKGKQAQCSSYVIRKALIRKHYLAAALHSYAVKAGDRADLFNKCTPQTWHLDIQFADELQELMMDDLYDLADILNANESALGEGSGKVQWFILKPGMADRGNGIRIFATLDRLEEIFEEFEPDSDDEDEEEEEAESAVTGKDTSVMTSQLRHFVIQEYIQTPMLVQPSASDLETRLSRALELDGQGPRKFHLRAYVLCVAGVSVYLHDDMLALFAPMPYSAPSLESSHDLRGHLTNTCLQNDGSIAIGDQGRPKEENVFLWSDLAGFAASAGPHAEPTQLTEETVQSVRHKAVQIIGATFEAAAKAGSIHWQVWPNAFEIFGVDLLVGYDDTLTLDVKLLEINAQPDFAQTGDRLNATIDKLFERTLELAVLPFQNEQDATHDIWSVGESRQGMTLCFRQDLGRGF